MAKGMTYVESDVEEVQMIFDTDTNKVVVNDPTKRVESSLHAGQLSIFGGVLGGAGGDYSINILNGLMSMQLLVL